MAEDPAVKGTLIHELPVVPLEHPGTKKPDLSGRAFVLRGMFDQ